MSFTNFNADEFLFCAKSRLEYLRAAWETEDAAFISDTLSILASFDDPPRTVSWKVCTRYVHGDA